MLNLKSLYKNLIKIEILNKHIVLSRSHMENINIQNAQKLAAEMVGTSGSTDKAAFTKKEEKKRDYDPILDDPISEGSDEEKTKSGSKKAQD